MPKKSSRASSSSSSSSSSWDMATQPSSFRAFESENPPQIRLPSCVATHEFVKPVKPRKLSTRDMLSYGHKPWDDDYYEWKETLERAFTEGDQQAADEEREEAAFSARQPSSPVTVKPVKLGFHEMLSYGHKPWDDDYRYWKEELERAFTEGDRQAAEDERRAACSGRK